MSAFVIDTSTMDRVVRGLCARTRFGHIVRNLHGMETNLVDFPTKIGRALYVMNLEAVTYRYGNSSPLPGPINPDPHTLPECYESPRFSSAPARHVDLIDSYKAMECLIYQCSEGNVPDSDLYKALDRASGRIAEAIVHALPAYDKAQWG